jgi:hypothetical protein
LGGETAHLAIGVIEHLGENGDAFRPVLSCQSGDVDGC